MWGAVLYGAPPAPPYPPFPDSTLPAFPPGRLLPDATTPFAPLPTLEPCAACRRHVVIGTDCPFCHADAAARREAKGMAELFNRAEREERRSLEDRLEPEPTVGGILRDLALLVVMAPFAILAHLLTKRSPC